MQDLTMFFQQSLHALFCLLVFPGGVFALLLGLTFKGLDRKIEARLQRRIGPPVLQPFIDLAKLCTKETIIPESANRFLFLAAPVIGFTGLAVCAALLPVPGVSYGLPNLGDLLVYFYLLPLPAVALMVAGSASSSPFGVFGFSREMLMSFAYEIPLLLVVLSVALLVGEGSSAEFSFANILAYQAENGQLGLNWRMIPAMLAFLIYIPGTMGVPPFDIPEAETEIIEGPLLEYSGPVLGFFHLVAALKVVVVLGLGVVLFFPATPFTLAPLSLIFFILKCFLLMLFSITVVKSATGRLRIDQALGFYLKLPTMLALLSLALVWSGV